ncbi:L-aminoadipate-semialdehydedehydrogenase-phosphopantetheinyl transferase [Raphidocelis subcapitata]|uniref:holo-[acyl-carrier-protein] synthase n=1 Tax=Raphidocelis subcapitata TaxID=307507 RepID=A0A2V0PJL6_9CHLO|nr:L-aminoadipate-semialdehydedehydrogenase-phosphopantetheinyl transferase [Raphidocelis subcapitata]|eukprot:GBF99739.1 L-aminoadipate-semialdehydedehydrogenase-phosphopantetheinyl transferase [Raphidocelis subcapitata]
MQPQQQPRHRAERRWLLDTAAWRAAPDELRWLAALLPAEDGAACLAYRSVDDQKRAVASRLLVRACCAEVLSLPWREVDIRRTRGRKPFCANAGAPGRAAAPNFNFNVSHEGDYVALACHPHLIVGVDVAAPQALRHRGDAPQRPLLDALRALRPQLTEREWARVAGCAPDEAAAECAFQQAWACKEAFVKARGDGLGFAPLSRIEVEAPQAGGGEGGAGAGGGGAAAALAAQVSVDGAPLGRGWRFELRRLPRRHWAAVALAPPSAVVDAWGEFRATLLQPQLEEAPLDGSPLPPPPFELLTVADLLPHDAAGEYEARFGG